LSGKIFISFTKSSIIFLASHLLRKNCVKIFMLPPNITLKMKKLMK
ncbi:hypothetical protein HMPREF9093_01716, partial [Fusobacterium sp. oral taxon 370 str. F0437]